MVIPEQDVEQLREALEEAAGALDEAANRLRDVHGDGHHADFRIYAERARATLKEKEKLDG